MTLVMKIVKQRVALWQVSAISIVGRGGNKKSVSITPIVTADHPWDTHQDYGHGQYGDEDGEDGEDGEEDGEDGEDVEDGEDGGDGEDGVDDKEKTSVECRPAYGLKHTIG